MWVINTTSCTVGPAGAKGICTLGEDWETWDCLAQCETKAQGEMVGPGENSTSTHGPGRKTSALGPRDVWVMEKTMEKERIKNENYIYLCIYFITFHINDVCLIEVFTGTLVGYFFSSNCI